MKKKVSDESRTNGLDAFKIVISMISYNLAVENVWITVNQLFIGAEYTDTTLMKGNCIAEVIAHYTNIREIAK